MLVLATGASANLLSDPGFENSGAGAWNWFQSDPGFTYNFNSTAQEHSGAQSLQISWSTSVPQYQFCAAEQDVSVGAGASWSSEAWGKVTTPLNNADAYLETFFYDSGMNQIGSLQSTTLSSVTDWTALTVSGTTPANTTSARTRLVVYAGNGASSGGTVYFDDIVAQVPEAQSFGMLGLGIALMGIMRRKLARTI